MLFMVIAKPAKNLRVSCSLISFMKQSIAKFVDLNLKKTETA